jgi:hypothetical protein
MEVVRCHLGAAGAPPAPAALREVLQARLSDPRKPRGIRHSLSSLVSVLVAGVACGFSGPLAIAGAAAGWDQEVLAAHGTRRNPRTGAHEPPSASTLGRLPALLDADELEAGLSAWVAPAALDPRLAARIAARAAAGKEAGSGKKKRRRKPPAGEALRETRADGWVRAAPGHPWLDPAVTGDPAHRPARPAVGVDGKERKLAKAGGKKKVHLLGAITHVTGLVIGQDRVAKAGKANEVTHFKPLLEPLPLDGVVITSDAMQATRENARWAVEDKRRAVTDRRRPGMVVRRHFEAMVFTYLAEELRTGDIAVAGAGEYADWRANLLPWEECEPLLEGFCAGAGLPATAAGFTERLGHAHLDAAAALDAGYEDNAGLVIGEDGVPALKRHRSAGTPEAAERLAEAVARRMPERSLLSIVARTAYWLGWHHHFGPASGADPKISDPLGRYCMRCSPAGSTSARTRRPGTSPGCRPASCRWSATGTST